MHTYTNTQTVTQIHTDSVVQGSNPKLSPSLDPLTLAPDPWAKGRTLTLRFPAAAGKKLSRALSYMHAQKTHTRGTGTAGERCKS